MRSWSTALRTVIITGIALLYCGCNTNQAPTSYDNSQPMSLGKAIATQNLNNGQLMKIAGVVGTASMLDETGQPAIVVMTKDAGPRALPASLDGIPVVVEITGEIRALAAAKAAPLINPRSRFSRPVPIGVSIGNEGECSAGTIGARVKDASGALYVLSNNHVLARENTGTPGSNCLQPGRYDVMPQCAINAGDIIGTLFSFTPIVISSDAATSNIVDGALMLISDNTVSKATPSNGYGTPLSTIMNASIRMNVQKYGRTTSLTKGYVYAVNAIVNVGYTAGTARFVSQIWVKSSSGGAFIKAGDSGSLLVTNPGKNPVGLLFAGDQTGRNAFANPIGAVLDSLHVTIDGL